MCRCWTQRIRSSVNFITYLELHYVLDYNYIVVPVPTGFFVSAYLNDEGVQEFLTWGCPQCINSFIVWLCVSFEMFHRMYLSSFPFVYTKARQYCKRH
jgi:hypothetical protein